MGTVFPGGSPPTRLSVICSVRNDHRHVPSALSSALTPDVAEVVVVDDRSTDGTLDVLRAFQRRDSRVRVVESPAAGRGAAIDTAFRVSTGELVMNLDADDAVHPEWIPEGVGLLHAHPTCAVVAPSPRYVIDDGSVTWEPLTERPQAFDVTKRLAFYNPVVHSGAIMRRAAVETVGGYDRRRRTHVDWDLWIRLAAAGWHVASVDSRLVAKRLHAGQQFERRNRLSYVWASTRVQATAIRQVGGGAAAWAALTGRLAWGLLPRPVRMGARRLLADSPRGHRLHTAGRPLERAHPPVHHV
jgi:glycosyltransferase involved in cell wall biosynthesis